jgi:DNA polymerase-1
MPERLVVIDGNSLVHRAFYAMPPMNAPDGRPTNAVFGFLNMLLKALDDYKPQYLCVAFDRHGPTFRHEKFAEYKAGRKPMPEDMRPQIPMLRELLDRMGIASVDGDGYEADDFLGTLAKRAEEAGVQAVLITGDRDALQLVDGRTLVVLTKRGVTETEEYTPEHLMEVYGLRPDQVPDFKGLMGDTSDNIPGIPGVGEKTALNLMHQYGSMDAVLAAGDIKGKLGERIKEHAELARFSRELATIDRDAPLDRDFHDMALKPWGETDAFEALEELQMRQILNRLRSASGAVEQKAKLDSVPVKNVETTEQVLALAEKLAGAGEAAVWLGDEGFALFDGKTEYAIPLMRDLAGTGLQPEEALRTLKPLFEGGAGKLLHDGKAWITLLRPLGINLNGLAFDTMIAGYLLNPLAGRYPFYELCEKMLGTPPGEAPAAALHALCEKQKEALKAQGMTDLYANIELPLVRVLADMEAEGFRMDSAVLKALGVDFEARLGELAESIWALAGTQFNINSPRQLGEVLFEKLGLPQGRKTKTGWSTDAEVLEQLSEMHGIVPLVMEYRQISKLKGTYVDGLIPLVTGAGRVHTTLHQTVTATGRISSSDPNLQNIPVRMDLGRPIRRAFIAGGEGSVLVDGDYSQIELRVLAHIARDERMLEAFRSGADFHRQTAAQVFGVSPMEVTDQMRSAAKAVNFGIVYGISDFGLARQLGISRHKAGKYIEKYLSTYSGVRAYMDAVVKSAYADGYVTTLFGRRRPMPELKSGTYNTRSFGERVAKNAPIQGTAADIIKLAMIKTHDELAKRDLRAKLILQVHDELIVDCPKEEAQAAAALLCECMESVAKLDVPLKADVAQGYSWYEAK